MPVEDVEAHRQRAADGAEAARRVRHVGAAGLAHHPAAEALQRLLERREALHLGNRPGADDHLGLARDNRRDQRRDAGRVVLVVGVGVHDHVGAEPERRLEAGHEGRREAAVGGVAHHVVGAAGARGLGGAVGRAVVDHQPLDAVEARHRARQLRQRRGKLRRLVEAGNLDDELAPPPVRHGPSSVAARGGGRARP